MFNWCCCYSCCLLCCFTHCWSTGWCCGALLCCEEEIQMSQVLLSDNSPQAAEATASTSVWGHCCTEEDWWSHSHWTEGEHCIWASAKLTEFLLHNKLWNLSCIGSGYIAIYTDMWVDLNTVITSMCIANSVLCLITDVINYVAMTCFLKKHGKTTLISESLHITLAIQYTVQYISASQNSFMAIWLCRWLVLPPSSTNSLFQVTMHLHCMLNSSTMQLELCS